MDSRIHDEAIKRNRRPNAPLPSKWDRFRANWPQEEQERERIRDLHAALLVRRSLIAKQPSGSR